MKHQAADASHVWLDRLDEIMNHGDVVKPRGLRTRELLHQTCEVDLRKPVLCCPARKLNYKFMAAEAYWILTGDDTVAGIAPYNSHIAQFSDDGLTFKGAYGPRIKDQLQWVIDQLIKDRNTRQAGLVIWRDKPEPSRDIPCTVSIWFTIRNNRLNIHVNMRSSDTWLGLPYDIFSFSMLAWLVIGMLNQHYLNVEEELTVGPGSLYLTAVSSHLYETNFEAAQHILDRDDYPIGNQCEVPSEFAVRPGLLLQELRRLRETTEGRWWHAPTN